MLNLVVVILMLLLPGTLEAASINNEDAVKAILGEAEDQNYSGMLAVAVGIRNRGTLHGVIGLRSKRVKSGKVKRVYWIMARKAWLESKWNRTHKGDHWENVRKFGKPKWSGKMQEVAVVGDHVFYKSKPSKR